MNTSEITERLDRLEELMKYLVQAVDRIGGMLMILTKRTDDIEERTRPSEIRKVAQS